MEKRICKSISFNRSSSSSPGLMHRHNELFPEIIHTFSKLQGPAIRRPSFAAQAGGGYAYKHEDSTHSNAELTFIQSAPAELLAVPLILRCRPTGKARRGVKKGGGRKKWSRIRNAVSQAGFVRMGYHIRSDQSMQRSTPTCRSRTAEHPGRSPSTRLHASTCNTASTCFPHFQ